MRIITGMHRSGTSLVTRLLLEAGADLGDPESLYPGDRWNPDGYFEQRDVHAVNMPLIHGPWGRLAYFALPSPATIRRRAAGMSARIRRTADRYRGKVVKDCRFCLTLPAWLEHGAQVDRVLVCLRDPAAVARSLKKRNRSPLRHGYGLWLQHNDRLLESARELPQRFVLYENLLDEGRFAGEIEPVFDFFGVRLPAEGVAALWRRCVKPGLNHHRHAPRSHPETVAARWRELTDLHRRQRAAGAPGGRAA